MIDEEFLNDWHNLGIEYDINVIEEERDFIGSMELMLLDLNQGMAYAVDLDEDAEFFRAYDGFGGYFFNASMLEVNSGKGIRDHAKVTYFERG